MIKHKWIGLASALLMAAAVLATGFVYANPSAVADIAGAPAPKYASAIDKTEVMDIQIFADEAEWADMLENATAEEYIPATVIINGVKLENIGIRPKGNSSLSTVARDSTTDRYSFKLEFDHYISGQYWQGLDKLAINNMQGDASYMKEYLSYDIMEYIGVAAPLYAFAEITVNGEAWGFYLAVETLEDSYAKRVYGNDHGMLYKPESMGMRGAGRMNEYIENMANNNAWNGEQQGGQQVPGQAANRQSRGEQPVNQAGAQNGLDAQNRQGATNDRGGFGGNIAGIGGMGGMSGSGVSLQYTGDDSSSYSAIFENAVFKSNESDYRRVIEALKKLSNGEDLENVIDVEAVLRYFAAHTVVVNLDSYASSMGHNYYLYEENGKLTILPWDYNLAFGGFQSGNASSVVNFPIDTPVSGVSLDDRPLLGKLLEVPEYLELYHGYLREIVDGYFNSGLFEQTMDSLDALISRHVENDPSSFYAYSSYQAALPQLKALGLLRAQSIEGQLNGTVPSTSEAQRIEADKLIDASGINLSALGNQGMGGGGANGGAEGFFGGGMNGGGENPWNNQGVNGADGNMPSGIDMNAMLQAMEIIQEAGGDLSEEHLARLKELGFSEEQISQIVSMMQGGVGNFPTQGAGEMQDNMRQGGNFQGMPEQGFVQSGIASQTTASGYGAGSWLLIGICLILLLCGLWFAFAFKRRRI